MSVAGEHGVEGEEVRVRHAGEEAAGVRGAAAEEVEGEEVVGKWSVRGVGALKTREAEEEVHAAR